MIERLNDETRVHHGEADASFDQLFVTSTKVRQYIGFLIRVYGFEAPVEAALAATPGLEDLLDLESRSRSSRISADLMALGLLPTEIAALPMCLNVPQFRGAAEALGWMYVTERTTLTHSVVRRHLLTTMPREMNKASAYLTSYAGVVGTRWRELGHALDLVGMHPAIADRVIGAAHDAFRCHRRWGQQEHVELARATG